MAKAVIKWNSKMNKYTAVYDGKVYASERPSAVSAMIRKEHRVDSKMDRAARYHYSQNLPPVR
jgi:predicted membrane-bound dolichyl-phosphate-mannose-protein mannosyltransferase